MSNQTNNRVVGRMGARELNPEELELIAAAGGGACTLACTVSPAFIAGLSLTCDSECPKP